MHFQTLLLFLYQISSLHYSYTLTIAIILVSLPNISLIYFFINLWLIQAQKKVNLDALELTSSFHYLPTIIYINYLSFINRNLYFSTKNHRFGIYLSSSGVNTTPTTNINHINSNIYAAKFISSFLKSLLTFG